VVESPPEPAAVTPVAPSEPVVESVLAVEPEAVMAPVPEQSAETMPATAAPQPEPIQSVETTHVVEVVPEPQPVAAAPPPVEEPPIAPAAVFELTPQAPPPAEPSQTPQPAPPLEVLAPAPEPEPAAPPLASPVEAVASVPEPEVAPVAEEPVSLPVAEPEAEPGEHRVVARLSDGGEIEVGVFASHEEARGAAKLLSRQIGTAAPGEWPQLGGRFVRPDLIVSVDLV
jgi:hypothetical protein